MEIQSIMGKGPAILNSLLASADLKLARRSRFESLRRERNRLRRVLARFHISDDKIFFESSFNNDPLPEGAATYLRADNPRLRELQRSYQSLNHPGTVHSMWQSEYVNDQINLQFFRGDSAYLWQHRDINTELNYLLTANYVKTIDEMGLLDVLNEDSLFGAHTVRVNESLIVSRDLLDSIDEIYFLERNLGISRLLDINILDIGAGYGRLAHRIVKALPNVSKVLCVDAVAESTFLSEYYLKFRGVDNQAEVVPLPDIETTLANRRVDIAVNVHSFSECTISSVNWWLDLIRMYKVKYLMIVPTYGKDGGGKLITYESDRTNIDYLQSLNSRGYELVVKEPKYLDPNIQRHGISPTYHYLFELTS